MLFSEDVTADASGTPKGCHGTKPRQMTLKTFQMI